MLERELEQLIKFYDETRISEQNIKVLSEIEKKITTDKRLYYYEVFCFDFN